MTTRLEDAITAFAAGVLDDEQLETIIHTYKELLDTMEQIDNVHQRAGRPTEFGQHVLYGVRAVLHSAENMKYHRDLYKSQQRAYCLSATAWPTTTT